MPFMVLRWFRSGGHSLCGSIVRVAAGAHASCACDVRVLAHDTNNKKPANGGF